MPRMSFDAATSLLCLGLGAVIALASALFVVWVMVGEADALMKLMGIQ